MRRVAPSGISAKSAPGKSRVVFGPSMSKRRAATRLSCGAGPRKPAMRLLRGIEGDDSGWYRAGIQPKEAPAYEGGVALALGWAQLTIGGQNLQQEGRSPPRRAPALRLTSPLAPTGSTPRSTTTPSGPSPLITRTCGGCRPRKRLLQCRVLGVGFQGCCDFLPLAGSTANRLDVALKLCGLHLAIATNFFDDGIMPDDSPTPCESTPRTDCRAHGPPPSIRL